MYSALTFGAMHSALRPLKRISKLTGQSLLCTGCGMDATSVEYPTQGFTRWTDYGSIKSNNWLRTSLESMPNWML
jgi:hypothetical protein